MTCHVNESPECKAMAEQFNLDGDLHLFIRLVHKAVFLLQRQIWRR